MFFIQLGFIRRWHHNVGPHVMSIRRLPQEVTGKITSSSSIVSLNAAICGLVKNSLDAGAGKVNIVLDYVRGNCTVEDNGEGILAGEFGLGGSLAKPNSTSRYPHSSSYHGRNGTFLASLAALSLVIITSNTEEENLHSSVAIHHGTATSGEADLSAQNCLSFSHGTRVAVFDLFGSMPVRVKHRASTFSTPSYLEKEFKALTHELTALLLAWPTSVSLSLREAGQNCQLRMRGLDGLSIDQQTSRLLVQAGLSDFNEANSWIPVAASNGSISVEGCINTIPIATRKSQFISLGIHPMERYLSGNVLFEEVNEIFTSSSFGVVEDTELDETSADSSLTTFWKPRKGLERWPMLYLRFKIDSMVTENPLQPRSSTLAAIISLLRAVCYAFLRRHKMRPRKLLHNHQRSTSAEGEGRSSSSQNDHNNAFAPGTLQKSSGLFDNCRRIKVGYRAGMAVPQPRNASSRLVGSSGQLLQKPFVEGGHDESFAGALCIDAANHTLRDHRTRPFEILETHCREGNGQWLERLIQSWKNPVFDTVEPAVCQLSTDLGVDFSNGGNRHSASTNISGSLSRSSLAKAIIIAQVDCKFVLIKLPLASLVGSATSGTNPAHFALFAVDQHAADERCRLEELMASYFEQTEGTIKPVVEPLDQLLSFDISRKELGMFAKWNAFWGGWGIRYQLLGAEQCIGPPARLIITGLPPSILERCRGEPRVLLDLLRKETWDVEENPSPESTKTPPNSNFRGCPRGILELLHSRACRSAIMFNDELTLSECTSLIRQLAQCSLPFQCAHGRPSMAPLVGLGDKTDNVLRTLPGIAFRDSTAVPVMPNSGSWATWMS